MLDFELEDLNQSTNWREVLSAYQSAHESAKASQEEFDGWLPRILSVEGLEDDDLPRIHGKLIAVGFLKFQLAGRGSGVVYQLSPAGRQALSNEPADESLDEEEGSAELEAA